MEIAIVILNWNGESLLETFLPSVVVYSTTASVYVLDNGSTDNSQNYVRQNHPEVQWIGLDKNYGFAGGYNKGLKNITADVYCLLNSDVAVTENWLLPIQKAFSNPALHIAQPLLLDYKKKTHFEYAGAAGGYLDKFGYAYCRGRIFDSLEENHGQYKDDTILWASGACLLIRAETFHTLQGFDDSYFMHQEEIDLCWRAFNQGFIAKTISASQVYHLGGATLPNSPKKVYYNFRNSLFSLVKNLPNGHLFPIVFLRMILDGIAGLRFLIKGEFKNFFALLKAHFSFYTHLTSLVQKRKKLPQKKGYYATKSIVWEHYILKKSKI